MPICFLKIDCFHPFPPPGEATFRERDARSHRHAAGHFICLTPARITYRGDPQHVSFSAHVICIYFRTCPLRGVFKYIGVQIEGLSNTSIIQEFIPSWALNYLGLYGSLVQGRPVMYLKPPRKPNKNHLH